MVKYNWYKTRQDIVSCLYLPHMEESGPIQAVTQFLIVWWSPHTTQQGTPDISRPSRLLSASRRWQGAKSIFSLGERERPHWAAGVHQQDSARRLHQPPYGSKCSQTHQNNKQQATSSQTFLFIVQPCDRARDPGYQAACWLSDGLILPAPDISQCGGKLDQAKHCRHDLMLWLNISTPVAEQTDLMIHR